VVAQELTANAIDLEAMADCDSAWCLRDTAERPAWQRTSLELIAAGDAAY